MLWGLLLPSGFQSSLGVNVGFFGMLLAVVGVTRRVPRWLRLGPPLVGTAITGAGVTVWELMRREDQITSAFATVVLLFGVMIAIVSTLVLLSRRGLVVQTPLRRNLVLVLVVWMSVSAIISFPVGVWKGRMGVAALVALGMILVWPPHRGPVRSVGSKTRSSSV